MTRCDPNFNQRMKSHGKVQNMPKCSMFKIHNTIIDFAVSFNEGIGYIASTCHYGTALRLIEIGVHIFLFFFIYFYFSNDQFKGRVMGYA